MPSTASHDLTIANSDGTTNLTGFMLYKGKNGRRQWGINDYKTLAPRILSMGEITNAELPPDVERTDMQENWQAGMGLINYREGVGKYGIAKGWKIDATSRKGILQLARDVIASTVDSNPDEYVPSGFANVGTLPWAFIGRDVYAWDYTNANWDIKTEPVAATRLYRNGVEYEGNVYAPAWADDAGSGGSYTGDDLPTSYIYKALTDAQWTLCTLNPRYFKYFARADAKLWGGYVVDIADSTENVATDLAFDATSYFNDDVLGTTVSGSHTASGSNRVAIVGVSNNSNAAPTGVTYGGIAMTLIGSKTNGAFTCSLWGLIAPATGAQTVEATWAGATGNKGLGVVTFTGAHQSTAWGTMASASGSDATATVDATSVIDDFVVDVMVDDAPTVTVGAGQTQRWNNAAGAAIKAGSTEVATSTTTTMSWTHAAGATWAICAVAVKPLAVTAAATSITTTATPSANLVAGDVVRLDAELMLVTVVTDGPPASITVVRGYRGTPAATHAVATDIYKCTTNVHHVRSSVDGTNTGTWSTATAIGQSDSEITALVTYLAGDTEILLVCKTDGIYTLNVAGDFTPLYNLKSQQHVGNCRGALAWDGNRRVILPLGAGGMLELYNDVVRDISFLTTMPDQTQLHGRVCAVAADVSQLFVLVQETANTRYHLMMAELVNINGETDYRWHHLGAISYTTGTDGDHVNLMVEGINSGATLHHRVSIGIESTGSNLLPYFYPMLNDTADAYTDDTDAEAQCVVFDANMPQVNKHYSKVDFTTANLGSGANDHYGEVKYRVDGGSWTWITGSQGTSKLTTNPQTLEFAAGITGKKIELAIFLRRGTTTTTTPQILDFTIKSQVRLTTVRSLPLQLYLADGQRLRSGGREYNVPAALTNLRAWRNGAAEVKCIMPNDVTYTGVFVPGAYAEIPVFEQKTRTPEYLIKCLIVET